MPLNIVRQDITKMNTDAIVAAEGHNLAHHGWVGSAIAEAAGEEYQKACEELGFCDTGDVRITSGYNLPAKYVIHAVGPRYEDGHRGEALLLKVCYEKCLKTALENGCQSIAFPLISTGGYGFPKKEALRIAIDTIQEFLCDNEMDIYIVTYDKVATLLSHDLEYEIKEYIDDNYVGEERIDFSTYHSHRRNRYRNQASVPRNEGEAIYLPEPEAKMATVPDEKLPTPSPVSLEKALKIKDESFQEMLLRLIKEKGLKNSEVYTKANMSKSHFSKINTNPDYKPKKETVFALAIALELDIDETKELLMKAGYALSHSFVLDTIVEYFILKKIYSVMDINLVLFDNDQPLLGEKAL